MALADNWGAETSPSGFELQFAADVEASSPSAADYIRQGGDIVAALQSVLNTAMLTEVERQRIRAQLDRARTGQPPLPPQPGTGAASRINWQMVGLAAVGIGTVWFLLRRKR